MTSWRNEKRVLGSGINEDYIATTLVVERHLGMGIGTHRPIDIIPQIRPAEITHKLPL